MSMIQQLKNNMMGGQQAAPQQLNPQQQQMVAGLQKQKQELQNNYNSASKGASFFSGAAQGMLDAPKNESFLASLARGINSGTAGLENHRAGQEKNLEKQSAIDAAIAQTYQFVDDYNYKRSMDKERFDIEREKIAATREGQQLSADVSREGQIGSLQAKHEAAAQKQGKEIKSGLKPYQQTYTAARKTLKEIELAKEQIAEMNPYGPVKGLVNKVGGHVGLAKVTGNDPTAIKVLDKRLTTILTYMMQENKTGRMTNYLAQTYERTKPDVAMGTEGMLRVLNDLERNAIEDMHRSEFVINAAQSGADIFKAEQLFDEDPNKAMSMLKGTPEPKEERRQAQAQPSEEGQQQQRDSNIYKQDESNILNEATKSLLED